MKYFYIGDLGYILHGSDWDNICDAELDGMTAVSIGGDEVVMSNTVEGDGVYYDQDDHEYSVDSGTIGIMEVPIGFETTSGRVVGSDTTPECFDDDGVLYFVLSSCTIVVDTKFYDDDCYYNDYFGD